MNTLKKYLVIDLKEPPKHLWHSIGLVGDLITEWIQPSDKWAMFLFDDPEIVHVDNLTISLARNELLVVPPSSRVKLTKANPKSKYYGIHFTILGQGERRAIPQKIVLDEAWLQMYKFRTPDIGVVTYGIWAFVWHLLYHFSENEAMLRKDPNLYEIEDWMRANLDRPVSVNEVSRRFNIPPRTLARMFQKEHDCGVANYMRGLRVREAIRLLNETVTPIKVIAQHVGISNSQQFNKFMHQAVGLSPKAIRDRVTKPRV